MRETITQSQLSDVKTQSLAGSSVRGRLRGRTLRRNVNHLAWAGVMKLLAGFFLNALRVTFELLDLLVVIRVFFLNAIDVLLKRLILCPFGAINHHAIRAEGHVHKQPDRKNG